MVTLDHAAFGHRAIRVQQVAHRLRQLATVLLVFLAGDAELVERLAAERVEDEHAVMRGDRAARLADDHRVRDLARVADVGDAVHHVVGVFVERVVHRRGEVGAAAVVVHAEAAAHVDVLQARAEQLQLRVDVRELVDGVLHAADVLQLAARVAVHELQAVEHVLLAQDLHGLEDFGDEQAELGLVAGRFAPLARAFAGELDAHADARPHVVFLRDAQDRRQLARNSPPPG